jgi:hypothetical protein
MKTYVLKASGAPANVVGSRPAEPAATLSQNRPNPFSDETIIPFTLAEGGRCKIIVCDLLGRVRSVLCNEILPAGSYTRLFSSGQFSPGTYLCLLHVNGIVLERVLEIER